MLRNGPHQFIGMIILKPHAAVANQGAYGRAQGNQPVLLLHAFDHIPNDMSPADSQMILSQAFQETDGRLCHRRIGGMVAGTVRYHHASVDPKLPSHLFH